MGGQSAPSEAGQLGMQIVHRRIQLAAHLIEGDSRDSLQTQLRSLGEHVRLKNGTSCASSAAAPGVLGISADRVRNGRAREEAGMHASPTASMAAVGWSRS